jgi:CspA family cold shock protein
MEGNRKTGAVKWFSRVKGYGFIAPEDGGKEIFVHFSGIEGEGYRNLEEGQRVSFVVEDTPKGPQAVQVRAEDTGEAPEPPAAA